MKKKSIVIASLAVLMLLMSSVSMAAPLFDGTGMGFGRLYAGEGLGLGDVDRLQDGSCEDGYVPKLDGSGNPNAPRGSNGRR